MGFIKRHKTIMPNPPPELNGIDAVSYDNVIFAENAPESAEYEN